VPGTPENSIRYFTYMIDELSNHALNFASLIKTRQAKHMLLFLFERPEKLSDISSLSLVGLILFQIVDNKNYVISVILITMITLIVI